MPMAVFRCDASPQIGAGHLSRCLAFAEAFAGAGWRVRFVVGSETPPMMRAMTKTEFDVRVLPSGVTAHEERGADVLVVDHYGLDRTYEQNCRSWAQRIVVFDDQTGRSHDCDVLIDAAGGREAYKGLIPEHANVLAGLRVALVRREFLALRTTALARRDDRAVENILVSIGATDPINVTPTVVAALIRACPGASITVAMSSKAPHLADVRAALREPHGLVLDTDRMAELMTQADIAVGGGGASAYERAVLGLPTIMAGVATNQTGIMRLLVEADAVVDAGPIDDDFGTRIGTLAASLAANAPARARMAQAASAAIDGRAPQRLLMEFAAATAHDGSSVRLRFAAAGDEDWLLGLQCEPATRRHARNPAVPTAAEHKAWMGRMLSADNVALLIVEANGRRAGMLRLDETAAARFEISIAVSEAFQGRGVASVALALVRWLLADARLDAFVQSANDASQALFRRAGYTSAGNDWLYNPPAAHSAPGPSHAH